MKYENIIDYIKDNSECPLPNFEVDHLEGYQECLDFAKVFKGTITDLGEIDKERTRRRCHNLQQGIRYQLSHIEVDNYSNDPYSLCSKNFLEVLPSMDSAEMSNTKLFAVSLIVYSNLIANNSKNTLASNVGQNMLDLMNVIHLKETGNVAKGNIEDYWERFITGNFPIAVYRFNKSFLEKFKDAETIDIKILFKGFIELNIDNKDVMKLHFDSQKSIHNFYKDFLSKISFVNVETTTDSIK